LRLVAEPLRLLMVCLGNICRSPMAEGALRHRLAEAGLQHLVEVDSAGTGGWHAGEPPDRRAIATAARHGVDISMLRARQLRMEDYRFDWLLCADRANVRDATARAPSGAHAGIVLLREWAGQGEGAVIADPYTGGQAQFDAVWRQVDAAAQAVVARVASRRMAG
jgi:protein-tyrosine phosphatase